MVAFLLGCANIGKAQVGCENRYAAFADIVSCTKAAMADSSRAANDSRVRAYFLRGDQLAEMVRKGNISNLDARVEWQNMYLELKDSESREGARNAAVYRALNPPSTTTTTRCTTFGGITNCKSN
jgi:hypothetical protein